MGKRQITSHKIHRTNLTSNCIETAAILRTFFLPLCQVFIQFFSSLQIIASHSRVPMYSFQFHGVSVFNLRVRDPAAAPRRLLGASPLLCRGRSRGARLLSRAVVGPVLRSLGRGAACSADGPRRWWCCGCTRVDTNEWITRWRMRPVHMAIALTRQVIQSQCHRTISIVRIGM